MKISKESFWKKGNNISETVGILFICSDQIVSETVLNTASCRYPNVRVRVHGRVPVNRKEFTDVDILVIPAGLLLLPSAAKNSPSAGEPLLIGYGNIESMDLAFLHGCEDYLVEPWLPEELFIRALKSLDKTGIDFGFARVFFRPFRLDSGGRTEDLSYPEYCILRGLSRHINQPVSRNDLQGMLGVRRRRANKSRVIDVHVSSLRKKLKSLLQDLRSPASWNPIRPVRDKGYALSSPDFPDKGFELKQLYTHATIDSVKNLISLPVTCILWTGLFCLGLLVLCIPGFAAEADFPLLLYKVIGSAKGIFLSSLIFGVFASHKRILHGKKRAYPRLGILLITISVLLYSTLFGLHRLQGAREMNASPLAAIPEDRVFKVDGKYLWIGENEGFTLKTLLVHDAAKGGFHVYDQGVYSPEIRSVRLLETGKEIPLAETAAVPGSLKRIVSDLAYAAEAASPKSLLDRRAAVFCLIFSLLLVSLHTLLRLTRWPLFNSLFAAGSLYAVLEGYRFLGEKFLPEAMKIAPSPIMNFAPLVFVLLPGIFLILSGLLLSPLREWRRDVGYE